MSEREINAHKGIAAIFAGVAAIGAALAAAYGFTLPAIIAGGMLIAAGALLVTTALAGNDDAARSDS